MRRLLIGCRFLIAKRESLGIEATLAQLGYTSNAPVDGLGFGKFTTDVESVIAGIRAGKKNPRSEEHTSELQSPCNLVCRLLLEKKKKRDTFYSIYTPHQSYP